MIRAVRANKKGFRPATFEPGVNLVLADRSSVAGAKDTTNALGKSTLIEIIDFCLGSNTSPGKGLRIDALQGWAFTLELTVAGNDVAVTSISRCASILRHQRADHRMAFPALSGQGRYVRARYEEMASDPCLGVLQHRRSRLRGELQTVRTIPPELFHQESGRCV